MVCLVINICKVAVKLELIVQWVSGHLPTVFSVRGGRTTWGGGDRPGEKEGENSQLIQFYLDACVHEVQCNVIQCDIDKTKFEGEIINFA